MTPEEIAAIEANIRAIVERGGGRDDVLRYLRVEGFNSRQAWLDAQAGARPVNTGPTPQPPFNRLPPAVGGTLDFLTAFGTGAGLGLPLLSGDTRRNVADMFGRAPGATAASVAAGAIPTLALAPQALSRLSALRQPPAPRPNPLLPPGRATAAERAAAASRAGPSLARRIVRSRLAPFAGGGGLGAGLGIEIARRLFQ